MIKPYRTLVFDEGTEDHFAKLLGIFHEVCVESLLCFGRISEGMKLEDIPMTFMGNEQQYLEKVVGGLMNVKADMLITSPDVELSFSRFAPDGNVDRYYCLQIVREFFNNKQDCCQIWEVNEHVHEGHLNKLWYEGE